MATIDSIAQNYYVRADRIYTFTNSYGFTWHIIDCPRAYQETGEAILVSDIDIDSGHFLRGSFFIDDWPPSPKRIALAQRHSEIVDARRQLI
jgi:hypothetical protein